MLILCRQTQTATPPHPASPHRGDNMKLSGPGWPGLLLPNMQVKHADLLFALSSATFIENLNNNEIFPVKSHNPLPACSGLASSERCGERGTFDLICYRLCHRNLTSRVELDKISINKIYSISINEEKILSLHELCTFNEHLN